MVIDKIINNNIVSAFDEKGLEVVIMGRGIGFQMKRGQEVPAEKIEKIFRIKSQSIAEQLKELLAKMPLEQVQISNEIYFLCKEDNEAEVKSEHLCYIDRSYQFCNQPL